MRQYYLASNEDRTSVDLRDYRSIIEEAVIQIMPNAIVEVFDKYYTVSPTPSQSCAIRIGRQICKSDRLNKYCVHIPKLFCSTEITEKGEQTDDKDN